MNTNSLVVAAAVLSSISVAHAQEKRVVISTLAPFDDALVCYQYYTVAAELARKLERDPKASADQAAGFQLQRLAANRALSGWSAHIESTRGKRTQKQIDADLKKLGEPVLADANAALGGDKAAADRAAARNAHPGDRLVRRRCAATSGGAKAGTPAGSAFALARRERRSQSVGPGRP